MRPSRRDLAWLSNKDASALRPQPARSPDVRGARRKEPGGVMTRVEVRLIGTIEVVRDGVTTPLAGKRVSALLVMLALADRAVPVDTLARAIWDDDPPERIRGSLQTYVGRLRRVIGAEAVRTESTGYRLALPAESVDLQRFTRLVARSADAEAIEAARILDDALTLWHAEPFGHAPSERIE